MFYPPPFGHPTQFSFPPYSTAHLPMPIYQENQVQPIIVKDIEQEHSEDAKDGNGGIYRNCLVCGDNNFACGWFIIAKIIFFLAHFQANTLDFKSVLVAE
jgi:hypothetical protein